MKYCHAAASIHSPISIAPMMDKTHRHFRWFLRQLSRQVLLYTEMITPAAIIHGNRARILDFDPVEGPLVLQLGGDNPDEMAEAIRIAEDWDYDEYNLNVGCPSDRVQQHNFGACLMADPERVARVLEVMHRAGSRPVSIKHRIGIEGQNISLGTYDDMSTFVKRIKDGPARRYIIHARVAILEGLSPKENRHIPPLRYEEVYRLKEEYPYLHIEINGGIRNYEEIDEHLKYCDGVMLGRIAYERPWQLASLDRRYYGELTNGYTNELCAPSRRQIIEAWFGYLLRQAEEGVNVRSLVWPVLELFAGERGSRKWKQSLSRGIPAGMKAEEFLAESFEAAPKEFLDEKMEI